MSDEQDKDALLVDQKDALGFYFDALLLPDENELPVSDELADTAQQQTPEPEDKQPLSETPVQSHELQTADESSTESTTEETRLQVAKDFLNASKLRQNRHTEADTGVNQNTVAVKKTISKGPLSPKPRLKENQLTEPTAAVSPEIVFSSKNDDGKVSEQVLIPRSQKLAAAGKTRQPQAAAKTIAAVNHPPAEADTSTVVSDSHRPSIEAVTAPAAAQTESMLQHKIQQHSASSEPRTSAQEAPNLDLSLFLPKIKTLSEAEIAQQIEALTQAAVSQAQMESELAHVAELEQVSRKILSAQTEPDAARQNSDNAPAWAVPDFQVLLFKVAGLKLAVPLTELNGIVEWGDEYITELPGHKSWYLGIIQNQGKSVPVIDTLQQVVPQKRWPADHLTKKKFKHIIMIDDFRWGLACEEVLEVITLKTDEVKWRSSRTKRRWLLGTVIEQMCALLDSSEFAAMLKTGEDSLLS